MHSKIGKLLNIEIAIKTYYLYTARNTTVKVKFEHFSKLYAHKIGKHLLLVG